MGRYQGAWSEDPGDGGLSSALGDTGATGFLQRSDTMSHALGSWMRTAGTWAGDSTGTRLEPSSRCEGRSDRFTGGLDVGGDRSQEDLHFCPGGRKVGADSDEGQVGQDSQGVGTVPALDVDTGEHLRCLPPGPPVSLSRTPG